MPMLPTSSICVVRGRSDVDALKKPKEGQSQLSQQQQQRQGRRRQRVIIMTYALFMKDSIAADAAKSLRPLRCAG